MVSRGRFAPRSRARRLSGWCTLSSERLLNWRAAGRRRRGACDGGVSAPPERVAEVVDGRVERLVGGCSGVFEWIVSECCGPQGLQCEQTARPVERTRSPSSCDPICDAFGGMDPEPPAREAPAPSPGRTRASSSDGSPPGSPSAGELPNGCASNDLPKGVLGAVRKRDSRCERRRVGCNMVRVRAGASCDGNIAWGWSGRASDSRETQSTHQSQRRTRETPVTPSGVAGTLRRRTGHQGCLVRAPTRSRSRSRDTGSFVSPTWERREDHAASRWQHRGPCVGQSRRHRALLSQQRPCSSRRVRGRLARLRVLETDES